MHFPDGRFVDIPVNGLLVWRDRFDAWLCDESGAEVLDGMALKSFVETDDAVNLACLNSRGETDSVLSKIMIAADGGSSNVVKTLQPEIAANSSWYFALQDTYDCESSLEPGYFHFYCIPEVSLYSSAYSKDGLLIMDVVVRAGDNPTSAMSRFRDLLWKQMNVKGMSRLRRLGCKVTYAAPKGLFFFGTDRILVCGEASGLLNLFGEGISSALSSGIIAGRASAGAVHENVVPGDFYKEDIEFERQKTQQTFDYRKLLFQGKGAFNFKKGIGCPHLEGSHSVFTESSRMGVEAKTMKNVVRLIESGLVPDALIRMGIRALNRKRLRMENPGSVEVLQERKHIFIEQLRKDPIAVHADAANRQHYELPPEFFRLILGKHRKYSCCLYTEGTESLNDAEENMLALTCERARLQDGMDILELGCGWGSLTLWMGEHYPNSRITAVSNSLLQGEFIRSEALKRGISNISVITSDMNDIYGR